MQNILMPYPEVPKDIIEKMQIPMDPSMALHIDNRNDLFRAGVSSWGSRLLYNA